MAGQRHGGNLAAAAEITSCHPNDILDFSASLNPLGPPQSILQAISNAREAVIRYPDPHSVQLRQAISRHYGVDTNWILPGNGAAELFTWAARSCALKGNSLIPQPAFSDYARALDAVSAPWEGLSCWDADAAQPLDLVAGIRDRLQKTNPPACLILNNPHNPTGQLWSASDLLELIPYFQLAIVDEAFMDFVTPSQSLLPWIEHHPQLVVVRSLTKFFAIAGLRIGFAVAHPQHLQQWQKWRDPWSVNGLATVAAIAGLDDREFQQKSMDWLPHAKLTLRQELNQIPDCNAFESAANFLLVNYQQSVADLQTMLLQSHHILIRDCLSFSELGDRYFRVAVRTKGDNLKLVRSLRASIAAYTGLQSPLN